MGGAAPAVQKSAAQPTKATSAQDAGMSALMGGLSASSPTSSSPNKAAAKPTEKTSNQASAKTKGSAKAKGIAELRFGAGGSARCVIKDINLQEMSGIFKREGDIPQLLEQAVLDIVDQEAGQVARINCYIRMLQAVENVADAETIKIVIRYVDDDPVKLDTLSRFIAKVR